MAILPFEGRNFNFIGTRLLAMYFLASTAMHCSMFIGYGINHLRQGSIELDYICELIPLIGIIIKQLFLLSRRYECTNLMLECRTIWNSCTEIEHKTVHHFEMKLRRLFNCLLFSCISINAFYSFAALKMRLPPMEPNGTERRVLPYRWFVDEVTESPSYEVVFAFQVMLLNNTGIVTMSIETAAPFLIMMTTGYFKVLQNRFILISRGRLERTPSISEYDVYQQLVASCKFHQSILNMCMKIKNLTRTLFLVQLLCTAYNLSLVGLKLASTDPDKYKFLSTFLFCLMQLFICQWAPEYLLSESEAVSMAAYSSPWATVSSRTGKIVMIIIQRSQRPVQITAAGVIKLSLETFGSMITSAISFFAVLRSLSA